METLRTEGGRAPNVYQSVKGNLNISGDNNVVNSTQGPTTEQKLRAWLTRHASKFVEFQKPNDGTLMPRSRDAIYMSPDFIDCTNNKGTTLILTGEAGSGKTTTIQALKAKLDKTPDTRYSAFMTSQWSQGLISSPPRVFTCGINFSARYKPSTINASNPEHEPRKILTYLLNEVARNTPNSFEGMKELKKMIKDDKEPDIAVIRTTLCTLLRKLPRVCIFIDALRYCGEEHLKDILGHLRCVQEDTQIGLVFTGLANIHTDSLEGQFPKGVSHKISAHSEDVAVYLRKQLGSTWGEAVLERVIADISAAANGTFLLVMLYCIFITSFEGEVYIDIETELKAILPKHPASKESVDRIQNAFKLNIKRVLDKKKTPDRTKIARLTIGFVQTACQPLSVRTFQWLLSTSDTTRYPSELHSWEYLKSCCHGLIEKDDLQNVVFLHRIMEDCLTEKDHLTDPPDTLHNEFAKRCLYHLTSIRFDGGVCPDQSSLDKRLDESPLLDYAAKHWFHHFQKSSGSNHDTYSSASTSTNLYHVARSFLLQDTRVEAAFQVTLFTGPELRPYLIQAFGDANITRISIYFMQRGEKDLLNSFQPNNMTGLHVACQHGLRGIAKEFIVKCKGQSNLLNKGNIIGYTPLHYAVARGDAHIAKSLLDAGSDINCRDLSHATPLILAANTPNSDMCQLLLEREGTNLCVNTTTHHDHDYQTHELELLVQEGIAGLKQIGDVLTEVSGCTALHYAARYGLQAVVTELLKRPDIDLYIKDSQGQIAWHKAAKYGHTNILRQFVEQELSPLWKIGESSLSDEVQPTPKMEKFVGFQNTALHLAARYGRKEAATYLLAICPEIAGVRNHRGETALSLATTYIQPEIVNLLVEKMSPDDMDAAIDSEDKENMRPLDWAIQDKSGECMKALLKCDEISLLHAREQQKTTPLNMAARIGQPTHIRMLLKYEFEVKRQIGERFNALDHAVDAGNWPTFSALWNDEKVKEALSVEDIDHMMKVLGDSNPPAGIRNLLKERKTAILVGFPTPQRCPIATYLAAPGDSSWCESIRFDTSSELVAHLKHEKHRAPPHCRRCHRNFGRDDAGVAQRDRHIGDNTCDRKVEPYRWENIDAVVWEDFRNNFEEFETAQDTWKAIHAKLLPHWHVPDLSSS